MPTETIVRASDPLCARAVRRLADELSRRTALTATVTEAPDAEDVQFADDAGGVTLRVTWRPERPADGPPPADWEIEEHITHTDGADGTVPPHAVRHYARTLRAVARNVEAARRLLKEPGKGRTIAAAPAKGRATDRLERKVTHEHGKREDVEVPGRRSRTEGRVG